MPKLCHAYFFQNPIIHSTMNKFTKIVATISDRRCDIPFIQSLYDNGLNVVRMNSAHLQLEGFRRIVDNVRAVSPSIAILMDTKAKDIPDSNCCRARSSCEETEWASSPLSAVLPVFYLILSDNFACSYVLPADITALTHSQQKKAAGSSPAACISISPKRDLTGNP